MLNANDDCRQLAQKRTNRKGHFLKKKKYKYIFNNPQLIPGLVCGLLCLYAPVFQNKRDFPLLVNWVLFYWSAVWHATE